MLLTRSGCCGPVREGQGSGREADILGERHTDGLRPHASTWSSLQQARACLPKRPRQRRKPLTRCCHRPGGTMAGARPPGKAPASAAPGPLMIECRREWGWWHSSVTATPCPGPRHSRVHRQRCVGGPRSGHPQLPAWGGGGREVLGQTPPGALGKMKGGENTE